MTHSIGCYYYAHIKQLAELLLKKSRQEVVKPWICLFTFSFGEMKKGSINGHVNIIFSIINQIE